MTMPRRLVRHRAQPVLAAAGKLLEGALIKLSSVASKLRTSTRPPWSPFASRHPRKQRSGKSSASPSRSGGTRENSSRTTSAPYGVWRQLRFLEFKINLWNLITEHLNETLAEIGTKMGFQAAIEQTGLPTLKDVEDAKNDLQTGRRNLTDLVKFTI